MLISELVCIFFKENMKTKKFKHKINKSDESILKTLDDLHDNAIATKKDIANLLSFNLQALCIKLYKNNSDLYEIIKIPKSNGQERTLYSPNPYLKQIQRNLLYALSLKHSPKICSHGFEKMKSIRTNADSHVGKRNILKFDLEDFFPSISFKRIYGIFRSEPYKFNKEIATFLAHICIYQSSIYDKNEAGILPQGAPTSPLLANLVCRSLDNELMKLAKKYKCIYTRYADDICISSNLHDFPKKIYNNNKLSDEILEIISKNDFKINSAKTKMMTHKQRQLLTGIIANEKLNIKRNYIKNTRAMLHNWKKLKDDYTKILFAENTTNDKIKAILKQCNYSIFFRNTKFKNYKKLSEEKKENLINETINSEECSRRYLYQQVACELSLIDVEQFMHEKLYKNQSHKPHYKSVLLGRIGYIKFIRGDEDNIYRKLWNSYCKITNSAKNYKPLIVKNNENNRLINMINELEENINAEFKENYDDKKLLQEVNAFLNSEAGGQLIFGINDKTGNYTGIDKFVKLKTKKDEDIFRTKITNLINSKFKFDGTINTICKLHKINNKTICRIEVEPHNGIVYYDENKYYIRQDGRTKSIKLEKTGD